MRAAIAPLVAAMAIQATPAPAVSPYCAAIAAHVDEAEGSGSQGPVFLRSYEPGPGEAELPPPLATSAFSYDNALAIVALASCGDVPRARRIADAFVAVVANDRTFADGRVRNAYRAGHVDPGPAKLPGWWDAKQNLWAEDAYQDGTQTGNVAWVALALLTIDQATTNHSDGPSRYRRTAETLAAWIVDKTADARTPGGFGGGEAGFDPVQGRLAWRSTEHNVDTYALGHWLSRLAKSPVADRLIGSSRAFLDGMFDGPGGFFRLGTMPDGRTQPPDHLALDALIWPLVGVAEAPTTWSRSLAHAKAHLAVPGGFDFNGDRDGLWTEGTAQAAFVERATGDRTGAATLAGTLATLAAPSGYLYATRAGRISTGIAIGPDSKDADFYYYHRPHLGATAWAVLATTGFNPFTGRTVD